MRTCENPACPDREALGIAGEYVDSIETCPQCGAPLAEVVEGEPGDDSPSPADGVVLAGCLTGAARTPLAKSLLEDAGIEFYTRNEITQSLFGWGQVGTGFNPVVGPVEFWVPESSLAEAKALLESLEADQATEHGDPADDDSGV